MIYSEFLNKHYFEFSVEERNVLDLGFTGSFMRKIRITIPF